MSYVLMQQRFRAMHVLLKVAVLPIFILVCLTFLGISVLALVLEKISTEIFFTLGHRYTLVPNL